MRRANAKANKPFPIVCIGLSSGGLSPLKSVFRQLSSKSGMAFVVVHHLRKHRTHLPRIIPMWTRMSVGLARHGQVIRPNHVYIPPSGTEIEALDGRFSVKPQSKTRGWTNVISIFLQSLARSRHPGIAVILSGADKDGAAALQSFEKKGGTVIVQEPQTATEPEMPLTAIGTGFVDYVLPAEAIAAQLEMSAKAFAQPTSS